MKILVFDIDENLAMLRAEKLVARGHQVVTISGTENIDLIKKILDSPERYGFKAIAASREAMEAIEKLK